MKYLRLWNIRAYLKYLRIYKIYAPHQECSGLIIYDSNKAAVEIFAPYERCMRPENWRPNSYYLGSAESISNFWLLLSLAEELSFRWCCLSSMQSSSGDLLSDRPACMGGVSAVLNRLLYRHDLPKYSRPVQMFAAANISTFFLGKIKNLTRLISVLQYHFHSSSYIITKAVRIQL